MKYFKSISAFVIIGLLISSCSSKDKKATSSTTGVATVTEKAAIPVKVTALSKTKIARTIDYTATILPFEEVTRFMLK